MKPYHELFTLTEQHIRSLDLNRKPAELYEPIGYMLSLGGKRLRPVLVLMACDLFGGSVEKAMPAALAVEVFHNFTLVHDDIMDNSPIRRGKPTVHEKWNRTIAILSGDLMMIKATELLCATPSSRLADLLALFNTTATEVCEGQQLDMNFEQREQVSTEEYLGMITLKTAVLLGCSLKLGAMIAGAAEEDAQHLYAFGKNIGVAFQIQDDILDAFGDGEKVGKKIGNDIAANKKTVLMLEAFRMADPATTSALASWLRETGKEEQKVAAVLEIYRRLHVREEAEKLMQRYLAMAFDHLDAVQVPGEQKNILRHTAEALMQRAS